MTPSMIVDIWNGLKPYIPTKDRAYAADALVEKFDEYGMADGIEKEPGLDKFLRTAVASYFHLEEEECYDDDESEW